MEDMIRQEENREYRRNNRRRRKSIWKKLSTTLALALVFGLVSGGTFRLVSGVDREIEAVQSAEATDTVASAMKSMSFGGMTEQSGQSASADLTVSQVAQKVLPSTVAINCTGTTMVNTLWGNAQQQYSSCGTGFIVGQNDEELLIATNNHVVADSDTVSVEFNDHGTADAVVKGTDPANDLAVIAVKLASIPQETMSAIVVAELGDFDQVVVGEQVVAIGNALGYGQSVTTGIVSALNRQVVTEGTDNSYLLQTDAAINPGNSGGALVNMQGQVIGINSAKAAANNVEGMGYAIPINVASPILDELMVRQTRTAVDAEQSSWLGIRGQDLSQQVAAAYHMPAGIYLTEVQEDSPASRAGMLNSDILTKFDGMTVSTMESLKKIMSGYAAGETITVTVERVEQGQYVEKELTVTLGHQDNQ